MERSRSLAPAPKAAALPPVEPVQLMQSMEGAFGVHAGQRRNHIKGTCAAGEFVGTPAAAKLRSALRCFRASPSRSSGASRSAAAIRRLPIPRLPCAAWRWSSGCRAAAFSTSP